MTRRRTLSGLCVLAGLALAALPLYAELFTKKFVPSELPSSKTDESEYAISTSYSQTFTMMAVPSWIPLIGGFLCLAGGFSLGRR